MSPPLLIYWQDGIEVPLSITHTEETRPKSPWTPSYSATTQGSPLLTATDTSRLEGLPASTPTGEQPSVPVAGAEYRPKDLLIVSDVSLHDHPTGADLVGNVHEEFMPDVNVEAIALGIPTLIIDHGHTNVRGPGNFHFKE
jgi:hypothetical protein